MLKRKEFILGAAVGLTFAAAATAGGVIDWPTANAQVAGVSGRVNPSAGADGVAFAPPQGAPLSFADIFDQVSPAVVQIEVRTRAAAPERGFIQIPGLGAVPVPSPEDGEGIPGRGAGSGFFISADGFIVTNNHVVADATEITVTLADQRELEARVVGRDEATDLAVLKVEGSQFPFVQFEEQAEPRVGDWIVAVGNPFGLGGTATAGIVSGLGRQNVDPNSNAGYVDFLQIDAAINRGNSGGPTFDIYGRVIGVNTAILSQTGGSVGIGFAVPASVAKPITDELMREGTVERGYVGLSLSTLSDDGWAAYGLPRGFEGAYVGLVTPGGPADRAGIEIGDVIARIDDQSVEDSTAATRVVGQVRPGETIRMEIIRGDDRRTINVRSGTRPPESELRADLQTGPNSGMPGATPGESGEAVEGINVSSLTPSLRARLRLPESASGAAITAVERGSAAAELGLRPGMLITRADRRAVSSGQDLRAAVEAVKSAGRSGILLTVVDVGGSAGFPIVLEFADAD